MRSVFAKTILILSLLLFGNGAVFAQGIVTEGDSKAWKERAFIKDGEQYTEKYCVVSDSIKSGAYLLFDEQGQIVTIATYRDNELHGEFWGLLPVRLGIYHQLGRYEYGQKKGLWKEKYIPPLRYRVESLVKEEVKYYASGRQDSSRTKLSNNKPSGKIYLLHNQDIMKPFLPESLTKVNIKEKLKN